MAHVRLRSVRRSFRRSALRQQCGYAPLPCQDQFKRVHTCALWSVRLACSFTARLEPTRMRWEDDEVRMTSLKTSEDTRALETRSVHGGGYVPHFFFFFSFLFFSFFSFPFLSFPFLSFFFFLPSVIMGHTQRRNSNTCQEPGPADMSDGMTSTNICQKSFILTCFVLSLSSFSVSVSVCWWCGVCRCRRRVLCVRVCVCACCGTLKNVKKNRVWIQKRLRVCIQNVPVYAGTTRTCVSTRARGAGTHGDVLNLHTESVLSLHTAVIASSAYNEQPT